MELVKYARVPIELNAEPGDEILILADSRTEPLVYEAIAAAAFDLGAHPTVAIIIARAAHGHEPTFIAKGAILNADLILSIASTSMTHTNAIRAALAKGKKYVAMPGVSADMLCNGAATADYSEVYRNTKRIAKILTAGKMAKIVSPNGTNITLNIEGRSGFTLAGKFEPGSIACFPDGEAPVAPVEGAAEGTLVFDVSMHGIGYLKSPIYLEVKGGRVTQIEGGQEANRLREILERNGDENAYNLGEFAIGTNPKARIIGNVSEDKKRAGMIHVALGDNITLGGNNHSRIHMDGLISGATVAIDGVEIVRDGQLIEEVLVGE
ncbi:aminopeptidase [Calderihabitans maritimus]|nr:aminopeptidase [Calderihabitans maritimus]